jgi:hypothetical protein
MPPLTLTDTFPPSSSALSHSHDQLLASQNVSSLNLSDVHDEFWSGGEDLPSALIVRE